MRVLVVLVVAACSFRQGSTRGSASPDATASDGAADAAALGDAPLAFCAANPQLQFCLSFDQDPLPNPLPDEGAVALSATWMNVGSTVSPMGRAATVDTTSSIIVPPPSVSGPNVTGILGMEIWIRMDVAPATNAREGMFDSNIGPNNMSLFYNNNYTGAGSGLTLRCGLGNGLVVMNASLSAEAWHYLVCTCDNGSIVQYVDGVSIGAQTQSCANGGAFETDGFVIGQNNNGAGQPVNDWLVGAIDGIRLWSLTITAHDACVRAGLSAC